jgi:hypothetical protein
LPVQVDRHLLPVGVIKRPVPVDLCNELLDLLLFELLARVLLQLLF